MKEQPPQVFIAHDSQLQTKTLRSKPSDFHCLRPDRHRVYHPLKAESRHAKLVATSDRSIEVVPLYVDLSPSAYLIWSRTERAAFIDRSNHLALPHRREAGRRRDGCGLQGRGHPPAPLCGPE